MISKFLFLFLSLSISLFALEESIADDLSTNAAELYATLMLLAQNTRWFFAIIPVVAIVISISKDISKIKYRTEGSMQQSENIQGEDIFKIASHVLIVLLSFYLIYGIFGLTYADASSMSDVWNILVFSFWSEIIQSI